MWGRFLVLNNYLYLHQLKIKIQKENLRITYRTYNIYHNRGVSPTGYKRRILLWSEDMVGFSRCWNSCYGAGCDSR